MIQNNQINIADLINGDRVALSRSITLVESQRKEDDEKKQALLSSVISLKKESLRIGITGSPGVGKSSFIEAFGLYLIDKGHKVAVLAIDPSSAISGGSILGDKTRMDKLSNHPSAYIRPSPSSLTLGGIAQKTQESIFLCEAAGFDIILIETVGVGQSEYKVSQMVDFVLMLLLPGAGDELQGVKRGILEMADHVAINKADGDNITNARQSMMYYKNAMHLFPLKTNGWATSVTQCSAILGAGLDEIWNTIISFKKLTYENQSFNKKRQEQIIHWVNESALNYLIESFLNNEDYKNRNNRFKDQLLNGEIGPIDAITSYKNMIDIKLNRAEDEV